MHENDPLEGYRVELTEETNGLSQWRVARPGGKPDVVVKLLGSIRAKMEEMHKRRLTSEDIRVALGRAVRRAERDIETDPKSSDSELEVMVRDSDLAELGGRVVGPTSGVPY